MARNGESFEAEAVHAYPSLLRSLTQDTYAEKGGKLGRLYSVGTNLPRSSFRLEILLAGLVLDLIPKTFLFSKNCRSLVTKYIL